ncbi:MAG TPA: imidazole glycerol phosphate synthase subunit HisH [Planctomycetota bacterium]|nr:imidazole glycerol phosphate synthase subunit HisH [Planctomycetota bacterium]
MASELPLTLLDYGVGNIHSIKKCFERAGASVTVETEPAKILNAKVLVLPGVGAFGKVAQQIAPYRDELRGKMEAGLPSFAVCIGMQILYESSDEGPGQGLSLFPGRVRRLRHQRLPHIGWNSVRHHGTGLFEGVPRDAYFYFVHSFAPSECSDPCVATTDYGDTFAAASVGGNVWAVQFHPEKSSDVGYRVVQNFVSYAGSRA